MDDAIPTVVENLKHSAQTWNDLINIPGGLLAYHKCNWQLIAWDGASGYMDMIQDTEHTLQIQDGKGASAKIEYLPPHQSNVGLGFRICPNANQTPHFQCTLQALKDICFRVGSAHLSEHETRHLLHQRLIPKLAYALHLSSFTAQQCQQIDTVFWNTILPHIRLNRHFPTAVLYGPIEYGGLEFPHT